MSEFESFKSYAWASVVTANLLVMARPILDHNHRLKMEFHPRSIPDESTLDVKVEPVEQAQQLSLQRCS